MLGSESQGSSTELLIGRDLYVKSRGTVSNAKGRAKEIVQSWCPVDFQLPTTGTSQMPPIDPMQTHVA